jgi:hypothetical protein
MNDLRTLHNNFNEPFGSFEYIVMLKNGHILTKGPLSILTKKSQKLQPRCFRFNWNIKSISPTHFHFSFKNLIHTRYI